jgi:hypothetical protein
LGAGLPFIGPVTFAADCGVPSPLRFYQGGLEAGDFGGGFLE